MANSWQSINFPTHFIRHMGFRLRIDPNDGSVLFRNDATFEERPGLATHEGVSFESVNFPGHYVRHQGFELWLHKNDGTDLFKQDATFHKRSGLADGSAISFESINYPGRYIRHSSFSLFLHPNDNSSLFKQDATFRTYNLLGHTAARCADLRSKIEPLMTTPAEYAGQTAGMKPLLKFVDGRPVVSKADWDARRNELRAHWKRLIGDTGALYEHPRVWTEHAPVTLDGGIRRIYIDLETYTGQGMDGYLLLPSGTGSFPAILDIWYTPSESVGMATGTDGTVASAGAIDFSLQWAKRGYVALAPGWNTRQRGTAQQDQFGWQQAAFSAFVINNAYKYLSHRPEVDPKRVGIIGHSWGSKMAMFAAAMYDNFAAIVLSDGGIAFDPHECDGNLGYWDPGLLGWVPNAVQDYRKPCEGAPRYGAYKALWENGDNLHELLALMAPRPTLITGGSWDSADGRWPDYISRWPQLNQIAEVNTLLEAQKRIGIAQRDGHWVTVESAATMIDFLEYQLVCV